MKLSHTRAAMAAVFDDPNLVGSAGLVPVLVLAEAAGLATLAEGHLSVPGDKGANAGLKVASLVAGMVAGADSIDDMATAIPVTPLGSFAGAAMRPPRVVPFRKGSRLGHRSSTRPPVTAV